MPVEQSKLTTLKIGKWLGILKSHRRSSWLLCICEMIHGSWNRENDTLRFRPWFYK